MAFIFFFTGQSIAILVITNLCLLLFRAFFNKLFLKSKCIFPSVESIEISKPNIRPFAWVIQTVKAVIAKRAFVHQG